MKVSGGVGVVYLFATWAIQLYGLLVGRVSDTDRETWLFVALNSRAFAKVALPILFAHGVKATVGEDVARVNQTKQVFCIIFHHFLLILGQNFVGFNIQDHIESVVVVRHLRAQSREIERILGKRLHNFAEQFVPFQRAVPRNPGIFRCVGARLRHRAVRIVLFPISVAIFLRAHDVFVDAVLLSFTNFGFLNPTARKQPRQTPQ
mmetsp:Transcript_21828/g.30842  ORF Transcript_21828/g.30842 Transcript_21828/m.30842 type:complete len:205 (-) Transcript_21828:14-628(-)